MDEGNKIREIRELFGLSRPEFAEKTGISVHTVHSTELGRMTCSIKTLRAVQKAYPEFEKWLNEIELEHGDGQTTPQIEIARRELKQTGTEPESRHR